MSVLIIIPARMASSRLPGKPLIEIGGTPMVVCVAQAAKKAGFGAPVIAAADQDIMLAAEVHDVRAVLTEADLPSGSDRVREAANIIDPDHEMQIVLNVQGDMPELKAEHIIEVVKALQDDPSADIATLAFESSDEGERADDNVVKVILASPTSNKPSRALYFTRAAAPSGAGSFWHHIGIYAFRRSALDQFCDLAPSPLELRERLEQLRALEADIKIVCATVKNDCPGIDSPEDLKRVRALWQKVNNK